MISIDHEQQLSQARVAPRPQGDETQLISSRAGRWAPVPCSRYDLNVISRRVDEGSSGLRGVLVLQATPPRAPLILVRV